MRSKLIVISADVCVYFLTPLNRIIHGISTPRRLFTAVRSILCRSITASRHQKRQTCAIKAGILCNFFTKTPSDRNFRKYFTRAHHAYTPTNARMPKTFRGQFCVRAFTEHKPIYICGTRAVQTLQRFQIMRGGGQQYGKPTEARCAHVKEIWNTCKCSFICVIIILTNPFDRYLWVWYVCAHRIYNLSMSGRILCANKCTAGPAVLQPIYQKSNCNVNGFRWDLCKACVRVHSTSAAIRLPKMMCGCVLIAGTNRRMCAIVVDHTLSSQRFVFDVLRVSLRDMYSKLRIKTHPDANIRYYTIKRAWFMQKFFTLVWPLASVCCLNCVFGTYVVVVLVVLCCF